MRLTLSEVITTTRGSLRSGTPPAEVVITGVSTDTRTLRSGELFVPLRGPREDGHTYVVDAFRRGAVAALCAQPVANLPAGALLVQVPDPLRALAQIAAYYRQTLAVTIVGVTGSVGKTTTTKMCAAALAARFQVAQTREEWNAEVGVPLTLLGLTPDHQIAIVEMGMRGLGQIEELVTMTRPLIGVVTTVGEAHLEFLGTRQNIARAKGELIAGLPVDGAAVLNADDPLVAGLAAHTRARVVTYGIDVPADVRAQAIRFDRTGVQFQLIVGNRSMGIALSTWGRHNVRNALAAAAVGLVFEMPLEAIRDGLTRYRPPSRRLEPVRAGELLLINDTYNASPASMLAAFEVLREVGHRDRRVAVLGGMKELGPESVTMHQAVGRALAAAGVRLLIAVGEEARGIADGAADAGIPAGAIRRVRDYEEAAALLRGEVGPGDVILVKGSRALALERLVELVRAGHPSPAGGRSAS